MNKPIIEKITDFVKSQSRNKIVFHQDEIPDVVPVNIGLRISEAIFNFKEPGKIPMRVSAELESILNSSLSKHDVYGKCLSIKNLGVLFEEELKLDFFRLLDNHSQNNVLFIKWEGEFDTEHFYFLTKANGIKVSIQNLSHIVI